MEIIIEVDGVSKGVEQFKGISVKEKLMLSHNNEKGAIISILNRQSTTQQLLICQISSRLIL